MTLVPAALVDCRILDVRGGGSEQIDTSSATSSDDTFGGDYPSETLLT